MQNEVESLIVKAGCTLGAYTDHKCRDGRGDYFPFRAFGNEDLIVKELEDSLSPIIHRMSTYV